MKIYKAYKFRMYPDLDNTIKLNQFLGVKRFIYNYYLSKKDEIYKNENRNYTIKEMKEDILGLYMNYKWLKEVDSTIIRTAIDDLDNAYTRYFKKLGSHPKYKSKNNKESYRTNCIRSSYKGNDYANIKVDLFHHEIKLPKLNPIKIRGYRNLLTFEDKRIINATVSKEANRYCVSVLVEENIEEKENNMNSIVGIDIGVANIITTSDGFKYEKMPDIKKLEKKIERLNKELARKEKGSHNRLKVLEKLARVYQKIKNTRKYYIHKITSQIIKDNDCLVTETLHVKEMIENNNKTLKKNIINSSFGEILNILKYKATWYNRKLINIDTYYPSSKICNHCGYKNGKVSNLSVRKYTCDNCGYELDRDINASINIMWEGFKKLYNLKELAS